MDTANEILTTTITKVEDFLEQMTTVITDHLALNDSALTVLSHDNLYNMSIVAEWFHLIPHVDIRLRPLPANITFDPNDNEYLESLGILVALPGFWLILTLLFFLIFFLCRCCDGSSSGGSEQQKQFHQQQIIPGKTVKPKRMTGCKLCLALIATITGFAITVGLLGSIIAHRGMVKLRDSTADIASVLETVQNDTSLAVSELRDHVDINVEQLKSSIEIMLVKDVAVKSNLETQLFFLKRNVTKCQRRVDEIYSRMNRLDIRSIPETLQFVERVRWPATFAFAFLLTIFCLILLCGLVRHSRCTLIMFSVFGLLALVLGWVLSSMYLGILVAGSDFCAEPDPFLTDRFSTKAELALYDYYVRCPISSNSNGKPLQPPFMRQAKESLVALGHMSELIRTLEMLCVSYCSADQPVRPQINAIVEHLNSTERLLKSVQALLDCRRIHEDFTVAMTSTCKDLVEGVFLMLATSVSIGLLFTLLVLCASHTWIHIRSGSPSSNANSANAHGSSTLLDNAEETDPFLTSTPHHLHNAHHHTMLSNNSTSSSMTNTSLGGKRFRDSYSSAYGTTGRGRFSHTPPQTPHFSTLGGASSAANTSGAVTGGRGGRSEEQLAFLSPPPAYDQFTQQQQQQLHYQQQQQQQQHQHGIYGTQGHAHTGTLPHSHHQHQHMQQPQMAHHPNAIGHYVADPNDIMMRAPTQATKF